MLSTLEDHYALISTHIQRVRDLTEQAANGTYGSQSLKAIKSEITARLEEINRIASNCEYNGINMMDGSVQTDKALQVGTDGTASKSQITLKSTLFSSAKVENLFSTAGGNIETVAKNCAGLNKAEGAKTSTEMLGVLDGVISTISTRVTTLGAAQNRIESAIESIGVQSENITSSLSTSYIG